MDCPTYHIPGTLSGQAIYDEADTKVRTIARRICEENLGFKKVEEALRVATGNHVGAAPVWNDRGQRKNTIFDHPFGMSGYWAAYSPNNVHLKSRILKDNRSAMYKPLKQANRQERTTTLLYSSP